LSLLKKEDELSSNNPEHNEYIIDLFEFFLILLTKDFHKYKRETMISEITEKLLPKMKIDSISKIIKLKYFIFILKKI